MHVGVVAVVPMPPLAGGPIARVWDLDRVLSPATPLPPHPSFSSQSAYRGAASPKASSAPRAHGQEEGSPRKKRAHQTVSAAQSGLVPAQLPSWLPPCRLPALVAAVLEMMWQSLGDCPELYSSLVCSPSTEVTEDRPLAEIRPVHADCLPSNRGKSHASPVEIASKENSLPLPLQCPKSPRRDEVICSPSNINDD